MTDLNESLKWHYPEKDKPHKSVLKVKCPVCKKWFEDGLLDYENHRREYEFGSNK